MLLTTSDLVEGKKIVNYLGIVSGDVVAGIDFTKDGFAKLADFFGFRVKGYEKELKKAKDIALQVLSEKAAQLGANAVIGLRFDCESVGAQGTMLLISVTGTAVVVE